MADNPPPNYTFCTIVGLTDAARRAISRSHNSKFHVTDSSTSTFSQPSSQRSNSNSVYGPPTSRLAFVLEADLYINPRRGVVFGTDPSRSDVLVGDDSDRGLSGAHFALSFAWDHNPEPTVLLLRCLSWSNDIGINDNLTLHPGDQITLDPIKRHVISLPGSTDLCFMLEITETTSQFNRSWKTFRIAVETRCPVRAHHRGRSETTIKRLKHTAVQPMMPQSYGHIRYYPRERGIHGDDLRKALLLTPEAWVALHSSLDTSASDCKISRPLYLPLSMAISICHRAGLNTKEDVGLKLFRAVALSTFSDMDDTIILEPEFLETAMAGAQKAVHVLPQDSPEYLTLELIYAGPMSSVYKKAELKTGRVVAVKQLELNQPDDRHRKRILDELRHNRMLEHPNIVNPELIIRYPGSPGSGEYANLVMEYFALGSLESFVVRSNGLVEGLAAHCMAQLLGAVAYLHRHQLAHRDIKLENVLIASLNPITVKLSDFGLVKDLIADHRRKATCCGTFEYMAPEVWAIRNGGPGPTTVSPGLPEDIWSLGVSLFRALTVTYPCHLQDGTPVNIDENGLDWPDAGLGSVQIMYRYVEEDVTGRS